MELSIFGIYCSHASTLSLRVSYFFPLPTQTWEILFFGLLESAMCTWMQRKLIQANGKSIECKRSYSICFNDRQWRDRMGRKLSSFLCWRWKCCSFRFTSSVNFPHGHVSFHIETHYYFHFLFLLGGLTYNGAWLLLLQTPDGVLHTYCHVTQCISDLHTLLPFFFCCCWTRIPSFTRMFQALSLFLSTPPKPIIIVVESSSSSSLMCHEERHSTMGWIAEDRKNWQ